MAKSDWFSERKSNWLFENKIKAARASAKLLSVNNSVIVDSETTDKDPYYARLVSLSVIDLSGEVLFDSLIDPQKPIPAEATAIHNITDDMVVGAPTFRQVFAQISAALHDKHWIIYNYDFDHGVLMEEQRRAFGKFPLRPKTDVKRCAMKMFARFNGEYSEYHESFTWKKLVFAAEYFGVEVAAPPHSALGDCLRTLGVIRGMSAWLDQPILKELIA